MFARSPRVLGLLALSLSACLLVTEDDDEGGGDDSNATNPTPTSSAGSTTDTQASTSSAGSAESGSESGSGSGSTGAVTSGADSSSGGFTGNTCVTHSECGSGCCAPVDGDKFGALECSTDKIACEAPCIDTCGPEYDGKWSDDGVCDEESSCEAGTDCTDCTPKALLVPPPESVTLVAHEIRDGELRLAFSAPIGLTNAATLLRVQGQAFEGTLTRPEIATLNGIPVPRRNLVTVPLKAIGAQVLTVRDVEIALAR